MLSVLSLTASALACGPEPRAEEQREAAARAAPARESTDPVLRAIVREHPCRSTTLKIVALRDDSLTVAERCSLVLAGYRDLATQPLGEAQRGDTASIDSVSMMPFAFTGLNGAPDHAYWSISFVLRERAYNAVTEIDRKTGRVRTSSGHKAF